jgi:tripartite-type tricarboxylate transporter receptor subunit TctC
MARISLRRWASSSMSTALVFFIAMQLPAVESHAQTGPVTGAYPAKPIRIIVPFPPGGSNDIIGRYIAQKLSARLAQPTVIDNRAGADAIIGTQLAANATADGYTLLIRSCRTTR